MERVLGDVLRDQRNLGNKGDRGWKSRINRLNRFDSRCFKIWDDIVDLCAKDRATGLWMLMKR
ncbi:hypothetical protein GmHk_02G004749 [Glycine max]|nr:hypothetical protein GmHk_02G004749 [Glycine max]